MTATAARSYATYRIYRKAVANAGEARTSAQDGNKIFSQKNTADDALNTGLDRWEVKLFDVVNTYDSGAVHSGASGDAGTTWVGIKDAVTVAGWWQQHKARCLPVPGQGRAHA